MSDVFEDSVIKEFSDYPMDVEIWVDVPGLLGYEVSNYANLRRAGSKSNLSSSRHKQGYRLYPVFQYTTAQYEAVIQGVKFKTLGLPPAKRSSKTAHRLCASAFYGCELEHGEIVDHRDGDVTNNNITNLRITSHRVNSYNSVANVRYDYKGGQYAIGEAFKLRFGFEASVNSTGDRYHPAMCRIYYNVAKSRKSLEEAFNFEVDKYGEPVESSCVLKEKTKNFKTGRRDSGTDTELFEALSGVEHIKDGVHHPAYTRIKANCNRKDSSFEVCYEDELEKYGKPNWLEPHRKSLDCLEFESLFGFDSSHPVYEMWKAVRRRGLDSIESKQFLENKYGLITEDTKVFLNRTDTLKAEFEQFFGVVAIILGHPKASTGGRHPAFHRFFNNSGKKKQNKQLLEEEIFKHGYPTWY